MNVVDYLAVIYQQPDITLKLVKTKLEPKGKRILDLDLRDGHTNNFKSMLMFLCMCCMYKLVLFADKFSISAQKVILYQCVELIFNATEKSNISCLKSVKLWLMCLLFNYKQALQYKASC